MNVVKRGKRLSLYRRVPKRYAEVEPRKHIWLSLGTDSPTEAEAKAEIVWQKLVAGWEAMLSGDTSNAEARFQAARDLAEARDFSYLEIRKVAKLPTDDLLKRVDAIPMRDGRPVKSEAEALLGAVPPPEITLTRALELYWDLAREKTLGKSPDQLRKWQNPRKKAVNAFIQVVGNKPLSQITADDMLDFRAWWLDRIANEGRKASSANKDIIHLGEVLKTVNKLKRLGLELPLSGLTLKEKDAGQRPPFSEGWIRTRLLAPNALNGLNPEARRIVLAMVNTGARPSELAALTAEQIRLDGPVPHISIEPILRELKSANARRVLPLCGVSLEAVREAPEGFPRYRDKSAGLSGTVNKYLRENQLMETPQHSLYSLRHSFEDRMLAAGIDERIRRDLMGHALGRERYGKGASLAHLHALLQPLAL